MLTTMLTFALAAIPQNTWTVDANSGPGTDFTDLPPAVAAAQSGDTIRMRAGSYTGATITGKALTIVGQIGATTIGSPAIATPALSITQQPTGTTTSLHGLTITGYDAAGLDAYGTRLVLTDVTFGVVSLGYGRNAMTADTCEVHALRCSFQGSNATLAGTGFVFGGAGAVVSGSVHADRCTFRGGGVGYWSGQLVYAFAGHGLVSNGDAWLTDCQLEGGAGTIDPLSNGGNALQNIGHARIAGASTLVAGAFGGFQIQTFSDTVDVHTPSIASNTNGNVNVGLPRMPRLDVTGASTTSGALDAMQSVSIDYDGVIPNAPYFFVVGFAPDFSDAFAPLLLGPMLIDLSTASLQLGTLDATASFSGSLVPANVLGPLTALPLHAQAGTFDFNTGEFRVSNGTITRFE